MLYYNIRSPLPHFYFHSLGRSPHCLPSSTSTHTILTYTRIRFGRSASHDVISLFIHRHLLYKFFPFIFVFKRINFLTILTLHIFLCMLDMEASCHPHPQHHGLINFIRNSRSYLQYVNRNCKCGTVTDIKVSNTSWQNPHRLFYTCI